jgi:hypothetical protein
VVAAGAHRMILVLVLVLLVLLLLLAIINRIAERRRR